MKNRLPTRIDNPHSMNNNLYDISFNSNIIFLFDRIENIKGEISKAEYSSINNSVDKRKNEYIAGRILTKKALNQLHFDHYDLLPGKDRQPLWPPGITGSISHNNSYVCTAVSLLKYYEGIGIDVEEDEHIDASQHNIIFTKNELVWIESLNNVNQENIYKIIFSAKESLYKCIFPIVKKYIDFKQVEMQVDLSNKNIKLISLDKVDDVNIENISIGYKYIDKQIFTYALYN